MNEFFLEVNGRKFRGFKTIQFSDSLEQFVSIFQVTYAVNERVVNNQRIPKNLVKAQDKVRFFIDNNLIGTCYVDRISISYDADNHTAMISGRAITCDLVDSSINDKSYTQDDFLVLARNILDDNGYNFIKIIGDVKTKKIEQSTNDSVGTFQFADEIETEASNKGKKIFQFLNEYAQKAQVLLRTNKNGNLIVTRENSDKTIGNLINTKDNPNNNIKSASLDFDASQLFRFNKIKSAGNNSFFTEDSISQESNHDDPLIRSPRRIITDAKTTGSEKELNNIIKWETNLRRAKALNYVCTVQGYYTDRKFTQLWNLNTLVKIVDDKCQLNGQFLIKGVSYDKDNDSGSTTTLALVPRGSFNLDPDKVVTDSSSNDFGGAFLNSD